MRLSLQKWNVKNKLVSGIFNTISIIVISHTLSNKKDPARILLRAGFAFALLCLAFKVEGVAVFFHCNKARQLPPPKRGGLKSRRTPICSPLDGLLGTVSVRATEYNGRSPLLLAA